MKQFFIFLFFIGCIGSGKTFSQTSWTKYSPSYFQYFDSFQPIADGGAIISTNYNPTSGGVNFYIFRTDKNGDTLWTRSISDSNVNSACFASEMKLTYDSCIILTGIWGNNTGTYIKLTKFDLIGNIRWIKLIPDCLPISGVMGNYPNIIETIDRGFLISNYKPQTSLMTLTKTDSLGVPEWIQKFDSLNFNSMSQLSDSGYLLAGCCQIAKVDKFGQVLWNKMLHNNGGSVNYDIYLESDSEILLLGYKSFIRMSISDTVYSKKYVSGNNATGYGSGICNNGDMLFAFKINLSFSQTGFALLRTDQEGNIKWSRRYSTNGQMFPYKIRELINGDIVILGKSGDSVTFETVNLIIADSLGYTACGSDTIQFSVDSVQAWLEDFPNVTQVSCSTSYIVPNYTITHMGVVEHACSIVGGNIIDEPVTKIYPNPSSGDISLSSSEKISEILIYNLIGKEVYRKNINTDKAELNFSFLDKGIYFCKLIFKNRSSAIFKIVLQ